MKKIIGASIIPGEFHPALGPKLHVRLEENYTAEVYMEYFFDEFEFDPITLKGLIGSEVSQEFMDEFGFSKK